MTIPSIVPVSCPACFGSALLPEYELRRLRHTVVFRCPFCQRVVTAADNSPPPDEAGDARAA